MLSALTRRSRRLLTLDNSLGARDLLSASSHTGLEMVPIHQITGSEGRGDDFDREFNPLQDHTRARWMGIAATQLRGKALPPAELTQVGDAYSIGDGHHRISVARALGQRVIEADVVICQMKGTWTPEAQKLAGEGQGARAL